MNASACRAEIRELLELGATPAGLALIYEVLPSKIRAIAGSYKVPRRACGYDREPWLYRKSRKRTKLRVCPPIFAVESHGAPPGKQMDSPVKLHIGLRWLMAAGRGSEGWYSGWRLD